PAVARCRVGLETWAAQWLRLRDGACPDGVPVPVLDRPALHVVERTLSGCADGADRRSRCRPDDVLVARGLDRHEVIVEPIAMSSRLAIPTTGAASVTLSFSAFTFAALRLNTAAGPTTQVKVPYAGTYSVNPDCTVEDIWVNQLNGGFNTHESILVDH